MMKRLVLVCAMLMMCWATVSAEEPAPAAPTAEDMANMPMGKPAEMAQVEWMIGTWDGEMTMQMGGPEPEKSKGVSIWKPILDGCCLENSYEGTAMGQPFKGSGTLCYNRNSKQWQNTWIDNMSAYQTVYYGQSNGNTVTFTGIDEMMGQKYHMKFTTIKVSDDKMDWKMEMSMDGGTTWMEAGSAVYTRRK